MSVLIYVIGIIVCAGIITAITEKHYVDNGPVFATVGGILWPLTLAFLLSYGVYKITTKIMENKHEG